MKDKFFNLENIVLTLLSVSFFIGIWHAFPMLNVINDEMYYVGGVFRALEHHTIVPIANDVPYGTLTYLCNYVLILLTLPIYFLVVGFKVTSLKLFLVQRPEFAYLTLRFLNSILALVMLYFLNHFLKKEVENVKARLFLLVILFTNIITGTILHTGKMWVMSMLLVVISFYYLNNSLDSKLEDNKKVLSKNIFLSILFSFLAVSNFPLNFYALINIPILGYYYRKDREVLVKILKFVCIGVVVYAALTVFNFEGIKNQIISVFTDYHPLTSATSKNLSFLGSLWVYSKKSILLFAPIMLVLLLSIKNKIKNKYLFNISTLYFFSYFLLIVFVANWTSDVRESLRYLFPLSLFFIFIISSFNFKFIKFYYLIGIFSFLNYCLLLYLLSVPTTYNQAYKWININLSHKHVIVVNNVPELQLVKNKNSSLLVKDSACATKCHNIIDYNLNTKLNYLVIDKDSKSFDFNKLNKDIYYIEVEPIATSTLLLVDSFTNESEVYHSVDYNVGSYFDLSFLRLKNLGKNIYIYKKI